MVGQFSKPSLCDWWGVTGLRDRIVWRGEATTLWGREAPWEVGRVLRWCGGGEGLVEGVERLSREAARIRRALLPRTESTSPPPHSLLSPAPMFECCTRFSQSCAFVPRICGKIDPNQRPVLTPRRVSNNTKLQNQHKIICHIVTNFVKYIGFQEGCPSTALVWTTFSIPSLPL